MVKTFREVFMGGVFDDHKAGPVVLEHPMSVSRPAWTSNKLSAADDLHGVRTYDGTAMIKGYFIKSGGLWNGWKKR